MTTASAMVRYHIFHRTMNDVQVVSTRHLESFFLPPTLYISPTMRGKPTKRGSSAVPRTSVPEEVTTTPCVDDAVSLASPPAVNSGVNDDETGGTSPQTSLSPLDVSLLACSNSPTACPPNFNEAIPKHNNPAPRRGKVPDSAHYWVDASGNILHLKFPAIISTTGQYSRLGPYFNLPPDGIDVSTLKKTRAQFELHPLQPDEFPEEAVACSASAFNGLYFLVTEHELGLSAATVNDKSTESGMDDRNSSPFVLPFCRAYQERDFFAIVANTQPIFRNIPDTNSPQNTMIRRSDIAKTSVSAPLSPSKIRAAALEGNTSLSTSASASPSKKTSGIMSLTDLPDPQGRYDGLAKSHNLSGITVHFPDVRDGHGKIIPPSEYGTKVNDGDVVEVEVVPKLWIIKPKPSAPPQSKDANGSHIYQLDLKKLKLLPYADYVRADLVKGKGKRKATDEGHHAGSPSPRKKRKTSTQSPAISSDDLTEDESMNL